LLADLLDTPRAESEWRIHRIIVLTPVLLADIARDINRSKATVTRAKREVRHVVAFLTGALTAPSTPSSR
jgi:hypothetical protein